MVGQGVLRECLLDPKVERGLGVGRSPLGHSPHAKLHEIMLSDVTDLGPIEDQLRGFDACFFCLGVSSIRMAEEDYRRLTYDLTLSVAQFLAKVSLSMTFVYVSGAGIDSSEHG